MYFILGGLSLVFILIGYTVTENNAQYILAGYNTMSEEERRKFNLSSYIPYFRRFHIFLGVSFFLFGLLVNFISENAGGVFVGVYPVMAYLYFTWSTQKYSNKVPTKQSRIAFIMGLVVLVLVISIFGLGYKEAELIINPGRIKISGAYGEDLASSEIKSVALTNQLPAITFRTNGFAAGTVKKGYFKTAHAKTIKLIINTESLPFVLITTKSGEQIYYSTKKASSEQIFKTLQTKFPDLVKPSTGL